MPGDGTVPDQWAAKCPLHPDAGFTLLVTERPGRDPDLWCRVGCPPNVIRYVLIPDPERDHEARRRADVLGWAQNWKAAA